MGIDRFLFGDPALAFLRRSLDVQQFRSEVVASNLANVDTPGYQARDVDFGATLNQEQERFNAGGLPMKATDRRHFQDESEGMVVNTVVDKSTNSQRMDGNTVDQDVEMRKLAESQLYFNASINAMARKLQIIRDVLSNARV